MARKLSRPPNRSSQKTAAARMRDPQEELIKNVFLGIGLFLLAVIVYYPAFTAGFIWDDDQLLTANPQVHSPWGWFTLWTSPQTADYFPLTSTTLWIGCHLGQFFSSWNIPFLQQHPNNDIWNGYHVMNVLFHAITVVLTWQTLKRLKVPGAWLAAAIFAVHPVGVESVAWISERKNTISQIFFLLSIIYYFRNEEEKVRWQYIVSVLCFTLSLLAKTSVVMLPFILILLTWWRNPAMERDRAAWKRLFLRMIPFFGVAFVLGLVTVYFQYGRAIGGEEIPMGNLWQRAASASFAAGFYLYSALWPFNLVEIYPQWHRAFREWVLLPQPHWQPPAPEALPYWEQAIPGLVIVGFLVFCFFYRHKTWARAILVGLGTYFIAMLPALGMLKMSYMRLTLVADHFQYISIAALVALVVAGGMTRALKPVYLIIAAAFFGLVTYLNWGQIDNNAAPAASVFAEVLWIGGPLVLAAAAMVAPAWKPVWYGFSGLVLFCFSILSWSQADIYHSEKTLWTATLEKNPYSWQAHNHLGAALYMEGNWRAAAPHFLKATQLKPENPESHNNLGLTDSMAGRMNDAIHEYETAVNIKDDSAMRTNLANAYEQTGQFDKAIENYHHALSMNSDNASAHCNLGYALMREGKVDEAIPEFMKTIELNPAMPQGRADLIQALRYKGVNLAAPDLSGTYSFDLAKALDLIQKSTPPPGQQPMGPPQ
ncbi:MAG TPA: tetratricopeptide repeat protein [Chthoniobacteraceae bacterium]|jgi:tetratricopeptide (TPR) repeat protein|nr:tetratricopeptide repeat protein [Chthoniobacteraceae bacterium]